MAKPKQDIEALAEAAKLERQTRCGEKINAILAEERCQFTVFAQLGETLIPLDQIITLPVILNVTSKPGGSK